MKYLIFLIFTTILIVSCKSDDDDNSANYFNLRNGVEFKVSSSSGIDLLNPNNANAYLENKIK
ncbi:hypothetical protein OS188_14675, partial [Xanthomarina sp. F1114]